MPSLRVTRAQLLNRVRNIVDDFLRSSLYSVARIELSTPEAIGKVDDYPGSYAKWIKLKAVEEDEGSGDLNPNLPIIEVFRRFPQLLILGDAGSGKTTLLNELAQILIRVAEDTEDAPVPIVVPLADWTPCAQFETWLVPALKRHWDIDARLGPSLLKSAQVVLLFDALDEVSEVHRTECVRAINDFRERAGLLAIVITCRLDEYERATASASRLRLSKAVRILPLEEHEVREYLAEEKSPAPGLLKRYEDDQVLRELVRTPLWLNVARLAFGNPGNPIERTASAEKLRRTLLSRYVDYMFSRPLFADPPLYSRQEITHGLKWLASAMIGLSRDRFYLEDLSEEWFPAEEGKKLLLCSRLVMGLVFVLVVELVVGMAVGMAIGLFLGLLFGVLFLLCGGTFVGQNAYRESAATLTWSWRRVRDALVFGLVYALAVGLVFGVAVGLFFGPGIGVVFGLVFGIVFGINYLTHKSLKGGMIRELPAPNEGTWRSARCGFFVVACAALLLAIPIPLRNFAGQDRFQNTPSWVLGLILGVLAWHVVSLGLTKGGGFWLTHWVFRLGARFYSHGPFRLDRFLGYTAHSRLFLQRIGGSYRFVHDVVREHFASVDAMTDS